MTAIIFDATTYRNANLTFAAGLIAKPSPAAFIPAAVDSAWVLGYDLGREGVSAGPSGRATAAERSAFNAGYAAGLDAYHAEERDRLEATIAQWEADHADYIPSPEELAEARMVA